jgi:cytochrome c oxidase subunit 2
MVGPMRIFGNLAASLALVAFSGSANAAGLGQPEPWQIGLQGAATPVAEDIHWFHNALLLPITAVITLFVLALLIAVIVKFNAKSSPQPQKPPTIPSSKSSGPWFQSSSWL